jgi:hypothetical protein
VFAHHPEFIFLNLNFINFLYNLYSVNIYFVVFENIVHETFYSPIFKIVNLLFILLIFISFINFYFSHYNTSVKEESFIDNDYLLSSLTIESEKEIGSLDDLLLGLVVLVYMFG